MAVAKGHQLIDQNTLADAAPAIIGHWSESLQENAQRKDEGMANQQPDAMADLYQRCGNRMAANPTMDMETTRDMYDGWGQVTAEPEGVTYRSVDIDSTSAIWAVPQASAAPELVLAATSTPRTGKVYRDAGSADRCRCGQGGAPPGLGYAITADDLEFALERQRVQLRRGDAVLIRTGWLELFLETNEMRLDQPGLSLEAARFLGEKDVALVGADNTSVEVQPWSENVFHRGHIELLVKRGIHLIEHVVLSGLSADKCYEFLFVTAPLRIVGATGSPVNPIAIG